MTTGERLVVSSSWVSWTWWHQDSRALTSRWSGWWWGNIDSDDESAEDDSPCHTILSWHITALQREDWPRHNRRPGVTRNIKQTNLFTIHSQCINQNVRKMKVAIGLLHATCALHRSVYISKLNRMVLLTNPSPDYKSLVQAKLRVKYKIGCSQAVAVIG